MRYFLLLYLQLRLCRDVNPSWIKFGWNDNSFSFHLLSVAALDTLAGGKKLNFFWIFKYLLCLKKTVWSVLIISLIKIDLHQCHKRRLLFLHIINFVVAKYFWSKYSIVSILEVFFRKSVQVLIPLSPLIFLFWI